MKKGIISVVVASIFYGMLPIITKWILLEGVNSSSTVFYRMFASMLVSFVILKSTGVSLKASGRQIFQMALFGILGFGLSSALLTVAYDFIPVGLASMLLFAYPLYVNIIMVVVFKEKLTGRVILSCVLSLAGLILLCDFSTLSATGIICAILSGVAYGIYIISNKKGNFVRLHGILKIFYVTMAASVLFGARALVSGQLMQPTSLRAVILILCLAVFTTVLPQYLLSYGITVLGASTASVLNMLEPVMDVILGWVFFREVISPLGRIGCVLIILSGIIIAMDTGKNTGKEEVQ